jgi:hypothetical protein
MNIRPIPIAQVFHIFRSIRLRNDVFHVRVHESLKLVESVPAKTGLYEPVTEFAPIVAEIDLHILSPDNRQAGIYDLNAQIGRFPYESRVCRLCFDP